MRTIDMLGAALGKVISFLPNLIAALVILAVGFLLSALLAKLTRRLLSAGLNRRRAARHLVEKEESLERVPGVAGRIVYWVLALVTMGVAVDALNLPWLSAGLARVLAYVPHVLAAGAIVAAAYLCGNFLYRRMSGKEGAPSMWGRLVRGAIFVFAGFMALQELGIATAIVTSAFTITLAALGVAAAVAFGLGNRELAGRITRDWYEQRGLRHRRYDPVTGEREKEQPPIDTRH